MSTSCDDFDVHPAHEWAIGDNPGEDGPDLFWCDGRTVARPAVGRIGSYPPGRVDTSGWAIIAAGGWCAPAGIEWDPVVGLRPSEEPWPQHERGGQRYPG